MEFIIGSFIGGVLAFIFCGLGETLKGGGPALKGTDKYKKYQQDADTKISEMLKNGSGSSKQELQEWWDSHHK